MQKIQVITKIVIVDHQQLGTDREDILPSFASLNFSSLKKDVFLQAARYMLTQTSWELGMLCYLVENGGPFFLMKSRKR